MATLVLTDSPRSSPVLRRAFGDDITVREIPIPLYKLKSREVLITANGHPKLEPVTKHIAELRKLASRFSTVLVVAPPVPYWYSVGWSIKKALAGLSIDLLFYFPGDLVNCLDVDPLVDPPSSMSLLSYACDHLVEGGLSDLVSSSVSSRSMTRRAPMCLLAVVSRLYENRVQLDEARGTNCSAERKVVLTLGERHSVLRETSEARSVPTDSISVRETGEYGITLMPPPNLSAPRLVQDILRDLPSTDPASIGRCLDTLYSAGCISHYESDRDVPDSVHEWSAAYLLQSGVSADLLTGGPSGPCVYVTGSELPPGQSSETTAIYAYLLRRHLLAYCAPTQATEITHCINLTLDGVLTEHPASALVFAPDSWGALSDDARALVGAVNASVDISVRYSAHFYVKPDTLYSTALSLGLGAREITAALYYTLRSGVLLWDPVFGIALTTQGFFLYSVVSRSSAAFSTSGMFSLAQRALAASVSDVPVLLEEADALFRDATIADMCDVIPATESGINIDPASLVFTTDSASYGSALHAGKIVPIQVPAVIEYLCPECGGTSACVTLGVRFTTASKCSTPSCTAPHQPLSLLPTLHNSEE
jgi:hypothetical protein